jgi:hypothetical protein
MNESTLSIQVSQMVLENQHLRVKSDNDDKTIHLMKEQYDAMAASVEGMRDRHVRELHEMRTGRDQAVRQFKTIDTLLLQASEIIMQALRARQGETVPAQIPDRPMPVVGHPLLPTDGIAVLTGTGGDFSGTNLSYRR